MGAVLTTLLAASDPAAAQGKPSFDCAKAASVAEKAICADPVLAQADAEVAKNYAALLKTLDAHAGKALRADQSDFIAYRDQIADFNENTPRTSRLSISANSCATVRPSWPASANRRMQV